MMRSQTVVLPLAVPPATPITNAFSCRRGVVPACMLLECER